MAMLYAVATAGAVGDGIAMIALPLATAVATRDPAATALVGAAGLLPAVGIQPLAGMWADRWPARHLMQIAAGVRAAALAATAVAVLAGHGTPPLLAITALITASGRVVHAITLQTAVPLTTRSGHDARDLANARVHAIDIGGNLLAGPLLGAAIVAAAPAAAFAAAAGCCAAAAGLATGLPRHHGPADGAVRQRWAMVAGLRWLAHHRLLRTTTLLAGASTVAYSITWPILPLYATGPLGLSPAEAGALIAAFAVGAITATPLAHHVRTRAGDRGLLLGVGVIQATAWTTMSLTISTAVTAIALAAIGASATLANNTLTSLRQTHAPPLLLGRVVATGRTITAAAAPAAALAGGTLATTSLRTPPLASAALLALATAALAPALLRTQRPPIE
ncbi:MFS family permease [Catenuloplanes nepalensis]|uniref:MFS family permease n=1 Tax=Catenuloplanes nepalensis TaxID=587533 RepID=A0ABT9MM70_9ACTN|nr:MFS transporter [Catenuloplanes nepalensis]MDP9792505.1 MFS family permease [Catenuloplanes nepalensis]